MKDKALIKQKAWLKEHEKEFIRAELNLCKLLFIWETSKSKKKSKIVEQKEILPDGNIEIKKITIEGVGEKGTLLTVKKHFKTLLALIKLYEDAGRPEKVTFGIHQLAEILDLSWGRATYRYLKEALEGLKKIPLTFENIFYNKQTGETEEFIKYFNWLENLEIYGKLKNKQPNLAISTYTFNKYIRQNILNNYTKPLFLNIITKLKTEIAILLYNHIDLIMANKNCYERNLKNLIEVDFKLAGNYPSPGHRKILFNKPIKELTGVKLTTGILNDIHLEKTKDGRDYKIVCRKSLPSLAEIGKESEKLAAPTTEKQAQDLVIYFHTKIGSQKNYHITQKEIKQAQALLKQYGEEMCISLIDYAVKQAQKTNFKMCYFGAILNYVEEAAKYMAQEKEQQEEEKIRQAKEEEQAKVKVQYEKYIQAEIDTYLKKLTPEQYQQELEKVKKEFCKKYRINTKQWDSSETLDKTVKAAFLNEVKNQINFMPFEEWLKNQENIPLTSL